MQCLNSELSWQHLIAMASGWLGKPYLHVFFFFFPAEAQRSQRDFPGLLSTPANEAAPCTQLLCSWFCKLRTFSHRSKSIASRSFSPLCLGMRRCSDVTTGTRAIPFGFMVLIQGEDAKATLSPPAPLTYIC